MYISKKNREIALNLTSNKIRIETPQRNAEHPTMKPIPLIAYQMGNSSKADDIVCDGFGGSGTTMKVCKQNDIDCIISEIDKEKENTILEKVGEKRKEKDYEQNSLFGEQM